MLLRIELLLAETDEDDPEEVVEWGAFGFIFSLAVLFFADALPRGISEIEYAEGDSFDVEDFLDCLRFKNGKLHLY